MPINYIDRAKAEGLLAEQQINEIIQGAVATSAALSTFRRINMGTKVARMPVLEALPSAGFVTEATDATGVKPTTSMDWGKKLLTAEEIACVVPIHEDVFDDTTMNVWNEVRPRIAEAFGEVLDEAVFFGVNKPASWPEAIVPAAIAAGNNVVEGASTVDLAEDINQVWAKVEADGFDVNIQYSNRALRARLRGLRSTDGVPLYLTGLRGDQVTNTFMGEEIFYVTNGSWQPASATLVAGDRNMAILGIRQDVTYKILTEATLGSGADQVNLAERDMIALRAKFRVAFQTATPITREAGGTGYPFGVLTPT